MTVVAAIMTWNQIDYLPYCIEGLLPAVDKLYIIEGAVEQTIKAGFSARSTDGTIDYLVELDQNPKVRVSYANNPRIIDQWEAIVNKIRRDFDDAFIITVDTDEIYDPSVTKILVNWIRKSVPTMVACRIPMLSFINDFRHYASGGCGQGFYAGSNAKVHMAGARAFGIFIDGKYYHTMKSGGKRVQAAPVKVFHYWKVRTAEQLANWKKWCPHKKSMKSFNVEGDTITHKTKLIRIYDGPHPRQMENHPYRNRQWNP